MLGISLQETTEQELCGATELRWAPSTLKYLGVTIGANLSHIYSQNYPQLLASIKGELHRWSTLPLTWTGRINALKMTILPKLLYYFHALLLWLPDIFFRS